MTKIITCSELRYLTLAEPEALFRTLQIELGAQDEVWSNSPSLVFINHREIGK